MYRLFCDSNCELWHTEIKELPLTVIRMPYTLDGEEYFYDMGEHTDLQAFFDRMKQGSVPKTSALNEFSYTEYFEPVLAKGEDIYYISFSHQMSGTFHAMNEAIKALKEKYPEREIRVFDTKMISLGSGFVVYYGAKKYQDGATMDELDEYLSELAAHTATYFLVTDLTYLYRGGRVSGVSKVLGTILNIKPILRFNDEGKIVTVEKVKGVKKAYSRLLDIVKAKGENLSDYRVYIMEADCLTDAEEFSKRLLELFPNTEIRIQRVGPVIGAHCGPGTLGVIFHAKEK